MGGVGVGVVGVGSVGLVGVGVVRGSRGAVYCLQVLYLKCVHRQIAGNLSFIIR